MKRVILISGKMQNGKDVAAAHIKQLLEQQNLTVNMDFYAKDLKEYCKKDFVLLKECLSDIVEGIKSKLNSFFDVMAAQDILGDLNEEFDKLIIDDAHFDGKKSPITRVLLQIYGTHIIRDRIDKNYWVNLVKKRMIESDKDVIIISDARFLNEIQISCDNINFTRIRIERNTGIGDKHISEINLDNFNTWNYIIDNNDTLESFKKSVDIVVEDILNPKNENQVPFMEFIER